MPLLDRFRLLYDVYIALRIGLPPTIRRVLREPAMLLRPSGVSALFMSQVWAAFADGVDASCAEAKRRLITPHAFGVVLDIGAGHGHTVRYLDPARVTVYVGLEPNVHMHAHIRREAHAAGFSEAAGTLVVLPCGAEDTAAVVAALGPRGGADTVVAVLALCSVRAPRATIGALVRDVLRPGGALLFFEHVRSRRAAVAAWQRVWSPLWAAVFGGCRLDRATDVWVREAGGWESAEVWRREGESEEHLFVHRSGRFVKAR